MTDRECLPLGGVSVLQFIARKKGMQRYAYFTTLLTRKKEELVPI